MTTDQERLDQIAARTEAATRGPWRWGYPGSASPELVGTAGDENYSYETDVLLADHDGGCACRKECTLTVTVSAPDAVFIAAAREDVPWLLSVVRDQAEQIAALQERIDKVDARALAMPHEDWCCASGCAGPGFCPGCAGTEADCRCWRQDAMQIAGLAAGEAPTEPATCKHGQTKPHRSCSLRTCPMDHDCPGPVPQGGIE